MVHCNAVRMKAKILHSKYNSTQNAQRRRSLWHHTSSPELSFRRWKFKSSPNFTVSTSPVEKCQTTLLSCWSFSGVAVPTTFSAPQSESNKHLPLRQDMICTKPEPIILHTEVTRSITDGACICNVWPWTLSNLNDSVLPFHCYGSFSTSPPKPSAYSTQVAAKFSGSILRYRRKHHSPPKIKHASVKIQHMISTWYKRKIFKSGLHGSFGYDMNSNEQTKRLLSLLCKSNLVVVVSLSSQHHLLSQYDLCGQLVIYRCGL